MWCRSKTKWNQTEEPVLCKSEIQWLKGRQWRWMALGACWVVGPSEASCTNDNFELDPSVSVLVGPTLWSWMFSSSANRFCVTVGPHPGVTITSFTSGHHSVKMSRLCASLPSGCLGCFTCNTLRLTSSRMSGASGTLHQSSLNISITVQPSGEKQGVRSH